MKALLLTALLLIAATQSPVHNPGFESEATHWSTAYRIYGDPDLHTDPYNEVRPPEGWVACWLQNYPMNGSETATPEVLPINLATFPDPTRIRSGLGALKAFTFYRSHAICLAQRVCDNGRCVTIYLVSVASHPLKHADLYADDVSLTIESGMVVLSAYMHAWYTNCSERLHDSPYDIDCSTKIDWAHQTLFLCVDPWGGRIDPLGENILCSRGNEQYGEYGDGPMALPIWTVYAPFMLPAASRADNKSPAP